MSAPVVARTRAELAAARADLAGRVAVVMTMGALHDGHASLLRAARGSADAVVATVFVNPLQFGPGEDFDRYPRTWERDLAVCAAAGTDVVFAPTADVVYPQPPAVRVGAGELGARLEGAVRPGHFDGVLTVVCKLLRLTDPHVALFGEKDAQQLALVRLMVRDLDLGVEVAGVPTVREPDGLAMSSRNRYLTPEQRERARVLPRALQAGVEAAAAGPDAAVTAARAVLAEAGLQPDYVTCVDASSFADLAGTTRAASGRLLVAARVGTTRLLDNAQVDLPDRDATGRR